MTVRELMSHTSGFDAAHGIFFGHGVDTWQQAADNALGQTLKFDPGTAFQYSNTNFCLLGLLIESVTGQAVRDRYPRTSPGADRHQCPFGADIRHPER